MFLSHFATNISLKFNGEKIHWQNKNDKNGKGGRINKTTNMSQCKQIYRYNRPKSLLKFQTAQNEKDNYRLIRNEKFLQVVFVRTSIKI